MFHIGIDFAGPLPESAKVNKYFLTQSEYCCDAVGLPSNVHLELLHDALFKVCVRFVVCICKLPS